MKTIPCPRCAGTGTYKHFGVCFRCKGARVVRDVPARVRAHDGAAQAARDLAGELRAIHGGIAREGAARYLARAYGADGDNTRTLVALLGRVNDATRREALVDLAALAPELANRVERAL